MKSLIRFGGMFGVGGGLGRGGEREWGSVFFSEKKKHFWFLFCFADFGVQGTGEQDSRGGRSHLQIQ